ESADQFAVGFRRNRDTNHVAGPDRIEQVAVVVVDNAEHDPSGGADHGIAEHQNSRADLGRMTLCDDHGRMSVVNRVDRAAFAGRATHRDIAAGRECSPAVGKKTNGANGSAVAACEYLKRLSAAKHVEP